MADPKPSCQTLFSEACLQGSALQDQVFQHYPDGECEKCSVSEFSAGPVSGGETLTRLIIHPIHFDQGKVSPMAFQDATTIDLSVFREQQALDKELQQSIDEIRATGQTKVPPQERLANLVMQARVDRIRSVTFFRGDRAGERMCFVYDTATPSKPSHASVFTPSYARSGSNQRQVRKALLELFSENVLEPERYRALAYEGR